MRTRRHVVHHLYAHVVFVTKYRRGVFTGPMPVHREELMREVRADFEVEPREFNGDHDHVHVHLLVHYPPKVAPSRLVNSPKDVSARMPRKEYGAHVRRPL